MNTIEKDFKHSKCQTCGNLTYWDEYFCKLSREHNVECKYKLKECEHYVERQGKNWDTCEGQECIFWCDECPAYKKHLEMEGVLI